MKLYEFISQLNQLARENKHGDDVEVVIVGSHGEWLTPRNHSDEHAGQGFIYCDLRPHG